MTWLTKLIAGRLKKDSNKLVDNEPELPCAKPEPKAAHHALASKLKRMVSQSQLLVLRNTHAMRNNDVSTVEVSIQLNPFGVKVWSDP